MANSAITLRAEFLVQKEQDVIFALARAGAHVVINDQVRERIGPVVAEVEAWACGSESGPLAYLPETRELSAAGLPVPARLGALVARSSGPPVTGEVDW